MAPAFPRLSWPTSLLGVGVCLLIPLQSLAEEGSFFDRILNIFGVDVLVNGFIPQTDTDVKVTATGNVANRGTILLVYAPYWGFAYKRQITLETARNIYSGTNDYVLSMRIGMVARGANASAMSYNVATTVS